MVAVVGAGPAGLLFCAAFRLLQARAGQAPTPLVLIDKRTRYERTHRLRIAAAPWRALGAAVADARFDALLAWLAERRFTPAVSELEERLSALVADLGVRRTVAAIGTGDGELTLEALRRRLIDDGELGEGDVLSIVGADSVNSAVRQAVAGDTAHDGHIHQRVVRLRIDGPGLPEHLGALEQFRLSKLADSLLDYRRHPDGYAEVDLFLVEREHPWVASLGAHPREPIPVDDARLGALRHAPLFARIVGRLREGFGAGVCRVAVTSTFRLEHRAIARVVFDGPGGFVFLVGDAAVSLPFFRGMACLAACAHALARTHVALAAAVAAGDAARPIAAGYDAEVAAIRAAELRIVEARGRLIGMLREVVRVSAMLPFPIQTWLSARPEPAAGRPTAGFWVNLAVAAPAAILALAAPVLDAFVWPPLGWLWLLAVPLQALGGVTYYAARVLEPGPDLWVRRVWRGQIAALLVGGVVVAAVNSMALGRPAQLHATISWWVLGIVFAVGMITFERAHHHTWTTAELDAG